VENDALYMLGIVAAGFAVNFGLRALPFLFFGARKGPLPPWVEKFGAFVSPVIIACLIVYSFAGMQWRTAAPYLAAALTGLVGFFTAGSRLLWAMARAGVVSPWLGRLSAEHRTPVNAILFVATVSMAAPLFGRNALGWLSDLCSLGAAGVALAAVFVLLLVVPLPGLNCAMKPHSWAILAVWIALGALLRLARRGGAARADPGIDARGRVS